MSFSLDIKYAIRLLFKKPMFTLLTVVIVAIGLGLTLYTYSLLNHLVFNPLTLNSDKDVIAIEAEFDYANMKRPAADPIDLYRVKNELDLFEGFGIYSNGGTALISGIGKNSAARKFNSIYTQWNIFQFAGVQPILGRGLQPEDHFAGAEPVIVLSYKVWKNTFAADKNIVGTMIRVQAKPTRIVGIMPEGFAFPATAETWQPISQNSLSPTKRQAIYGGVFAYARLKDGVEFKEFEKELANLNQKIVQSLPEVMKFRANSTGSYLKAYDYKKVHVIQHYPIFISMFVVVFLILLLACINISNLLLARVNNRLKEIAIRIALGVPRVRLIMQMLWESLFICGVGGFLALLIAGWGLELSNGVFEQMFAVNQQKPFWWQMSLDGEAIAVLIFAVLLMIVITGFWPALRAMSGDFNATLRDGTRGAVSKKSLRMNKVIVVTEVFLSCVVLVIATILLSTTYSAGQADYGVATEKRLTAQIELPFETYPVNRRSVMESEQHKKRLDFFANLKDKLEDLPNVNAVAFMRSLPGTGGGAKYVEIEGRVAMTLTENPSWNIDMVAIDSWEALGIKVIAGRDFDYRDNSRRPTTSIISESLAKKHFPDGDAIGKRTRTVGIGYDLPWQTIIGIVSDVTHGSVMDVTSAKHTAYVVQMGGMSRMTIAIHYTGSESLARQSLQETISNIDSDVAAYHIQSYEKLIGQPMILLSAVSQLFLFCGVMAVLLAASGIYAVSANSIIQRTQEIGVRRALGATDAKVMNLFMGQAGAQLIVGLAIGLALSFWAINIMTDTMIINNTSYAIGLIGMPLLVVSMVLLATYIPTRKIVLMEPSDALHHN